jgi:Domain of unknown function (DUF4124)
MNSSRSRALRRSKLILGAALLGLAVALPASAQWKWRDKSGQTQYSDLPPPSGVAEQDILQRPNAAIANRRVIPAAAPASAASAAPAAPALLPKSTEPELEAKRKKAEQEAADKRKAEEAKLAATRAENCTRAKAQMRTIDSGVRMTRVNEKGEREFLDDAARAAETQRARDAMASECK